MSHPRLHYIYDPLCGWCYGASPLVRAARDVPGLPISLHGGGMMAGAARQRVSEGLRQFVLQHDRRIAALSGQAFGEAYQEGLLRDPTAILDSEPPTAAVIAAETLAQRGLDMLARIQSAHYVEGRRVADLPVLTELAAQIGLDAGLYAHELAQALGGTVQDHIAASRRLLAQVGGRGFPTFALQIGERIEMLDMARWYGRPEDWRSQLLRLIA